jgi:hypothetical protein
MNKTRRDLILATVEDLMGSLLYYDRKEDDGLPVGAIEEAIEEVEVTVDELVAIFKKELE